MKPMTITPGTDYRRSEWQGARARMQLGLSGEVERDQFRDMLDGKMPNMASNWEPRATARCSIVPVGMLP